MAPNWYKTTDEQIPYELAATAKLYHDVLHWPHARSKHMHGVAAHHRLLAKWQPVL